VVFCAGIFSKGYSHNVSLQPSTSINRVAQVATEQLVPGERTTGSIPAAEPGRRILSGTQFTVLYPGGGAKLTLEFHPDHPVNLYVRRNVPVIKDGDKVIYDADLGWFNSQVYSIPIQPPFNAETYFIALENAWPTPVNFTLTASLSGPPDADTIDLSVPSYEKRSLELGSIPMPADPNACALGRTQYTISVPDTEYCDWPTAWIVQLRGDRDLNLYVRNGQRVTVEDGKVVADFSSKPPSGTGVFSASGSPSQTPRVRTFFIAVENCNPAAAVYSLTFEPVIPDLAPPFIANVFLEGKALHVTGFFQDPRSVLFDGEPQKTKTEYDGSQNVLIVKGARNKIRRGETVMVSVKQGFCTTRPFPYTRTK